MLVRQHLFILNPRSFLNSAQMDQVITSIWDYFEGAGNYMLHISRFPRDAVGFISAYGKTLPNETILRVYAVGGDGILFDCLNGVMNVPKAELAAVPWGPLNNFVRGFGKTSFAAFRDISRQVNAPAISMDVIYAGGNYAINFCTIGGESLTIRHTNVIRAGLDNGSRFRRWLCRLLFAKLYYLAAIPAILNKTVMRQQYTIEIDGEDHSGRHCRRNIANGSYYGGNKCPQPAARPDDGMLDILLGRSAGILRMVYLLPLLMTGRLDEYIHGVTRKRARKISICSETPLLVNLDEIVFYDTDFTVELLPGALRFVDAAGRGYRGAIADD